jgi:2-methylfumaryl-CoA isomerase
MIAEVEVNGAPPPTATTVPPAFGRDFPTRDGRRVMVAAISERQWAAVVSTTGLAAKFALVEQLYEVDQARGRPLPCPRRHRRRAGPVDRRAHVDELRRAFDAGGVLWSPGRRPAPVRGPARLDRQPADVWSTSGDRPLPVPRSTLDFAAAERLPALPAPVLGQHTDEVLADVLGLPAMPSAIFGNAK